jgi:hypothetical protein
MTVMRLGKRAPRYQPLASSSSTSTAHAEKDPRIKFVEQKWVRLADEAADTVSTLVLSMFSVTVAVLFSNTAIDIIKELFPRLLHQAIVVFIVIALFNVVIVLIVLFRTEDLRRQAQVEHNMLLQHIEAGTVVTTDDLKGHPHTNEPPQ